MRLAPSPSPMSKEKAEAELRALLAEFEDDDDYEQAAPPQAPRPTLASVARVNAHALIEKRCPPWVQAITEEALNCEGLTPSNQECGKRTMRLRFKAHPDLDVDFEKRDAVGCVTREFDMPFYPYVRAVDPAGNLVTLLVSTTRDEKSAEEIGYRNTIISRKKSTGWLIAELDQEHNGRVGQEHLRYCLSEMIHRRRMHAEKMAADAVVHQSRMERALESQGDKMAAASEKVAESIAKQSELITRLNAPSGPTTPDPAMISAVISALKDQGFVITAPPAGKAK